jgi:hypothetical protein
MLSPLFFKYEQSLLYVTQRKMKILFYYIIHLKCNDARGTVRILLFSKVELSLSGTNLHYTNKSIS